MRTLSPQESDATVVSPHPNQSQHYHEENGRAAYDSLVSDCMEGFLRVPMAETISNVGIPIFAVLDFFCHFVSHVNLPPKPAASQGGVIAASHGYSK